MAISKLTDDDYVLAARVAEREGWADLENPPLIGAAPRTLAEQSAVAHFAAAVGASRRPRSLDPRAARAVMLAALGVGLVACWMVSPGRTAVGLLVAGAFCLWAVRRRRRAVPAMPRRRTPATAWTGGGGRGR